MREILVAVKARSFRWTRPEAEAAKAEPVGRKAGVGDLGDGRPPSRGLSRSDDRTAVVYLAVCVVIRRVVALRSGLRRSKSRAAVVYLAVCVVIRRVVALQPGFSPIPRRRNGSDQRAVRATELVHEPLPAVGAGAAGDDVVLAVPVEVAAVHENVAHTAADSERRTRNIGTDPGDVVAGRKRTRCRRGRRCKKKRGAEQERRDVGTSTSLH